MLIDVVLVLVGLAMLAIGGESLIKGASGLALLAKITPAVIGLTVVAAGTSMPELVVSVQAALGGSPGIAIGNPVGSNLFNISLVLGTTSLFYPLVIRTDTLRIEWPVMMAASCLFYVAAMDHTLSRTEGAVFLVLAMVFTAAMVRLGFQEAALPNRDSGEPVHPGLRSGWTYSALVAVGAVLLAVGSRVLVQGSVGLAEVLGISDTIIGLTVVAVGTSAPELAASLIAARRGSNTMAISNVMGSNIFNMLAILGAVGVVRPTQIPPEILTRDAPWMLLVSVLLFPLIRTNTHLGRTGGIVLLLAYVGYAINLVMAP